MGTSDRAIQTPTRSDRAGLDRSTVCKILWNDRGIYVSDRTREKVKALAQSMGYEYRPKQTGRSSTALRDHNISVRLEIRLLSGEVYASGKAVLIGLSQDGAVLADLDLKPAALPVAPCYGRLRFSLDERAFDVRCDFRRISLERFVELGVKFAEITVDDHRDIGRYVAKK